MFSHPNKMKTFQQFIYEMSYRGMSQDRENRIKKQITAAKKSEKAASKEGDFEAADRHNMRYRAMKSRVKKSDLPF
jgi:hypothetical protein